MVPRRPLCSCRWTVPPGGVCALTADRCQIVSRRAGTVCDVLHRLIWIYNRYAPLHPYIPYYNRRLPCPVQRPACRWCLVSVRVLRLTVCLPALRGRYIGGLYICCIVCSGMGQINGNAAAKPCKRFLRFGRINCMDGRKAAVNACKRLKRRQAK